LIKVKEPGPQVRDKPRTQGKNRDPMSAPELALAILALLLTPGPTNSLMLLAGAERGLIRACRLIPAELAGYFLTVVPLVLVGQSVLENWPGLRAAVALAAAIWVAFLALMLWRLPDVATAQTVGAKALFVTTSLNPKALIFGLVLLPSPDRLVVNLVLFAALIAVVALLWAGLGALLRGTASGRPRALFVMRRLASVFLAIIAVLLVMRGVTA
jgi:threonine/homoserine/homoserine lactone efflux protein